MKGKENEILLGIVLLDNFLSFYPIAFRYLAFVGGFHANR
jgi:DNA polymerase sigma